MHRRYAFRALLWGLGSGAALAGLDDPGKDKDKDKGKNDDDDSGRSDRFFLSGLLRNPSLPAPWNQALLGLTATARNGGTGYGVLEEHGEPARFVASLSGAQETPPVASPAIGGGSVLIDEAAGVITVSVGFSGLTSAQTMAHIHGPAGHGVSAGVLIPLPVGQISGLAIPVTAAQIARIRSGLTYFNVHTAGFPNGEIRGQIEAAPGLGGNLEALSVSRRGNVTTLEGRFRRADDPANLLPGAALFLLEADSTGGDTAELRLQITRGAGSQPFYTTAAGAEVRSLTFEGFGAIED